MRERLEKLSFGLVRGWMGVMGWQTTRSQNSGKRCLISSMD